MADPVKTEAQALRRKIMTEPSVGARWQAGKTQKDYPAPLDISVQAYPAGADDSPELPLQA